MQSLGTKYKNTFKRINQLWSWFLPLNFAYTSFQNAPYINNPKEPPPRRGYIIKPRFANRFLSAFTYLHCHHFGSYRHTVGEKLRDLVSQVGLWKYGMYDVHVSRSFSKKSPSEYLIIVISPSYVPVLASVNLYRYILWKYFTHPQNNL